MSSSPPDSVRAIRDWEQKADELFQAAQEETDAALKVIPAALESSDASDELARQFEAHSRLPKLAGELDEARSVVEALPPDPTLESVLENARFKDRAARVMVEASGIFQPLTVLTAAWRSLEDETGGAADRTLRSAFEQDPTILHETQTSDTREEDRKVGLFALKEGITRNLATYQGKPPSYYKTVVRNEARRDFNELDEADNNHLGLTPKTSRYLSADDRRYLNQTAEADVEELPGLDVEAAMLSADERAVNREILSGVIAEDLTGDQQIYALMLMKGVEPRQALEEMGRPKDWDFHTSVRRRVERLSAKCPA